MTYLFNSIIRNLRANLQADARRSRKTHTRTPASHCVLVCRRCRVLARAPGNKSRKVPMCLSLKISHTRIAYTYRSPEGDTCTTRRCRQQRRQWNTCACVRFDVSIDKLVNKHVHKKTHTNIYKNAQMNAGEHAERASIDPIGSRPPCCDFFRKQNHHRPLCERVQSQHRIPDVFNYSQ